MLICDQAAAAPSSQQSAEMELDFDALDDAQGQVTQPYACAAALTCTSPRCNVYDTTGSLRTPHFNASTTWSVFS